MTEIKMVKLLAVTAAFLGLAHAQIRIMPFGASIVGAPGCWRALLWQKWQVPGVNNANTKFVGSLPAPDCGFPYDGANEGHAGSLATEVVAQGNLTRWLADADPDIVIVLIGTNDVIQGKSTDEIIAAYTSLVNEISLKTPNIIWSNLLPISPKLYGQSVTDKVVELNAAVEKWFPTAGVNLIDNFSGFNATTDTVDGEHPNAAGNEKIANNFDRPVAMLAELLSMRWKAKKVRRVNTKQKLTALPAAASLTAPTAAASLTALSYD